MTLLPLWWVRWGMPPHLPPSMPPPLPMTPASPHRGPLLPHLPGRPPSVAAGAGREGGQLGRPARAARAGREDGGAADLRGSRSGRRRGRLLDPGRPAPLLVLARPPWRGPCIRRHGRALAWPPHARRHPMRSPPRGGGIGSGALRAASAPPRSPGTSAMPPLPRCPHPLLAPALGAAAAHGPASPARTSAGRCGTAENGARAKEGRRPWGGGCSPAVGVW